MQFEVNEDVVSAVIFQGEHYYRNGTIDKGSFVGVYERTPVENDWHKVEICLEEDDKLIWKNEAEKSWSLDFDGARLAKADDVEYDAQVNKINIFLI